MRTVRARKALLASMALLIVLTLVPPVAWGQDVDDAPRLSAEAEHILGQMSSLEKVGQLFLVTFAGNDLSATSDIARLVQQSRVGGVVLSPENGNFVNNGDATGRLLALANGLQSLALSAPLTTTGVLSATGHNNPVPLLIAVNEEGDAFPHTAVWSGLTPLPNAMAMGATWNPSYAEQVGEIAGRELTALGINMLLGPSLDVLDKPRPTLPDTLGTRAFGGDPYWVSKFGQAYIRGIHKGGQGRVLTVAKHFPGLGGADRDPNEELPTIQKSLETLRSIELVPFFSVTAPHPDDHLATTDGMMTSHVRYRGLQGNIRQLSRPISLDAQNLPTILALPEFAPWRAAGGLLVSQALGVPSIRKFYDPSLQTFPGKRIAQEAFLAGNDLLYLSRFDLNDDWKAQAANVEATVLFFRDKYDTDPTFKTRVDESVGRILQAKLSMVGAFDEAHVLLPATGIAEAVGQGYSVAAKVAQDAATLIYPSADELSGRLPSPPLSDERILIITDDRRAQECAGCLPFHFINPTAIQSLILRLYGPDATGQIAADQVTTLTFSQLKRMLAVEAAPASSLTNATPSAPTVSAATPTLPAATPTDRASPVVIQRLSATPMANTPSGTMFATTGTAPGTITATPRTPATASVTATRTRDESRSGTPTPAQVAPIPATATPPPGTPMPGIATEQDRIREADWIIFAMLDVNVAKYPDSDAVHLFLRERSDSLQGKKLVVLAFNAPYFLDATEVSKLTVYYGLYGRTAPFLEAAVRLLFQEYQPRGASPVDVDAIGYQIIEVTRPDPNQVINIEVVTETGTGAGTPTPTSTPQISPEGTPIPIKLDLKVGDVLTLRTSKIVDRNGRAVPDGTPVEFRLLDVVQSLEARLPPATTVDGVAMANFNLDRSGTWQITAASDTAQRSVRLIVTIPETGPVEVGIDRPTPTTTNTATATAPPTDTPTITATPSDTPIPPTETSTPTATPTPEPVAVGPAGKTVAPLELLLSIVCLALAGSLSFRVTARRSVGPGQRMKRSLIGIATGLIGYVLFAIGLVPLERIPFVAWAVHVWFPYELLAPIVCLIFFGLGAWLTSIRRVRRAARYIVSGRSG